MSGQSLIQLEIDGTTAEVDLPTLKQMVALGQVGPATRIRHEVITNGRWLPIDRTTLVFLFPRSTLRDADNAGMDLDAPLPLSHIGSTLRKELRFSQLLQIFPLATVILITLNTAALALVYWLNGKVEDLPALIVFGAKQNHHLDLGQWWRLVSCMFLHGGILHLVFNMYALFVLGRLLEGAYGRLGLLGLYTVSGVLGSLASYQFTALPSVGASGAVFGLLGAAIVFGVKFKRELPVASQKGLVTTLLFWLGVSLFFGFTQPNVDNFAHLGGLVGGVVFATLSPSRLSTPERWRGSRVAMGLIGALAIGVLGWGVGRAALNVVQSGYFTKIRGKTLTHSLFSLRYPANWRVEFQNPKEVRVTDDTAELSVIVLPLSGQSAVAVLSELLAAYQREMSSDLCGLPCWLADLDATNRAPKRDKSLAVRFAADGTVATIGAHTVYPATLELQRGDTVVFAAKFYIAFVDAGKHRFALQFGVDRGARRHYRKHVEYMLNHFQPTQPHDAKGHKPGKR